MHAPGPDPLARHAAKRPARGVWLALAASAALPAQEALVRTFGRADGLTSESVRCIASDARGFLWLGTADGLTRHDGVRFIGLGVEHGLATPQIDAIAPVDDGTLCLGMHGPWIARHDPSASPPIRSTRIAGNDLGRNVCSLCVDAGGTVYFATEGGLLRARQAAGGGDAIERVLGGADGAWYSVVARGAGGEIVYFTTHEVARIDGSAVARLARPDARVTGNVWAALQVGPERWLVLEDDRLVEVDLRPLRVTPRGIAPPPGARFTCLCADAGGTLWIGSTAGLLRLRPGAGAAALERLDEDWIRALGLDRDGNLWCATQSAGLRRRSALPFAPVRIAGSEDPGNAIGLWRHGDRLIAATERGEIAVTRGEELAAIPASRLPAWSGPSAAAAVDGQGTLWLGSEDRLVAVHLADVLGDGPLSPPARFPLAVDRLRADVHGRVLGRTPRGVLVIDPRACATAAPEERSLPEGCPDGAVLRVDPKQRAWLATASGVVRAGPASFELLHDTEGNPIVADALVEDRSGGVWLLSWRKPGVRRVVGDTAGVLALRAYGSAEGLPEGLLWNGVEDARGHLWLAGPAGLVDFDPALGQARHLRWPDRVAPGAVSAINVAADGAVWIAGGAGVFRFDPAQWLPAPPPLLVVEELSVAGRPLPVPGRGTVSTLELVAPADSPNLALRLAAPDFSGTLPRFQHRLLPVQQAWSAPSSASTIQLAGLASGRYELEVRTAVAATPDAAPQLRLHLTVPPPLWRSPLFLGCAALTLASLASALHRLRVRRRRALEGVRRRIAIDLHDDLGAGLAQVAVLSEAAKRRDDQARAVALDRVAQIARRMRESLGDIVWAVNPASDALPSLVHRLRDVAITLFPRDEVLLELAMPRDEAIASVHLAPDRRRHVLLVAKEALTNCARHARARRVRLELLVRPPALVLRIADDGVGFDPGVAHAGCGLASLRQRARELGGTLAIDAAPGRGSTIELITPLR